MKVLSHRVGEDEDDVRLLARELDLNAAHDILALAESIYGDRLDAATQFFVMQLYES
jgi:hypothetical protein